MAQTIKHAKVSAVPDGTDTNQVQPTDWNANHVITGSVLASEVTSTATGDVAATNVQAAIAELASEKAPLASPAFTGTPTTAATPTAGDNTTKLATTAFVATAITNAAVPPATVVPLMDGTAAVGTTTKYAREDHIHPSDTSRAPLNSPAFTGTPSTATTPTAGDNTTKLATTAFVTNAVGAAATKASTTDVLTGTDTIEVATPDAIAALWEMGTPVAAAATITLGEGGTFHITGTATVTDIDFATPKDGRRAWLIFDSAGVILTHNATTLKIPGNANITTQAGDRALIVQDSSDNIIVLQYVYNPAAPLYWASNVQALTGTATNQVISADALAALWETGTPVAAAATVTLGEGGHFSITGAATITDIDFTTDKSGRRATLVFAGASTLTHSATLILPGAANIVTAAGDIAEIVSEGTDIVRVVTFTRADGRAVVGSGGVTISDTAPSSPQPADLWWESDTGILYVYYNDGNTSQWVQAAAPAGDSVITESTFQTFGVSGTYTPTAGMIECFVELWGAGGGGGGGTQNGTDSNITSGGGSGAYSRATYTAATIGSSQAVAIAAAGTAGTAGGGTGGNGGTSTFGGTLLTAPGGNGGQASGVAAAAVIFGGNGGLQGTVSGCITNSNFLSRGTNGSYGTKLSASVRHGGSGGDAALLGGGGRGGTSNVSTTSQVGSDGFVGGGGGGGLASTTVSVAGGAGGAGLCYVKETIVKQRSNIVRAAPVLNLFTASGTYTPSANIAYCVIEMVGAGGGGGGSIAQSSLGYNTGGGGGGGGYARSILTKAQIGASQVVTVGAAGAAGAAAGNGGDGGVSSVGSLVIASGGSGGAAGTISTGSAGGGGGPGGANLVGQFIIGGHRGNDGWGGSIETLYAGRQGTGGHSLFGYGAVGGRITGGGGGQGYGAGGGGGNDRNTSGNTAKIGGPGTQGVVLITEYF